MRHFTRRFWLGEVTYADILLRRRYERSFRGWRTAMGDLIEATFLVRVWRDLGQQCTAVEETRALHQESRN